MKKAVHIIRDPFDNTVSRFHHAHKIHKYDEKFILHYPKTVQGFQAWCSDLNHKYIHQEAELWDEKVYEASKKVPCRAEFYRYIQWHNLAFSNLAKLDIPTLLITYEDYGYHLDKSLMEILDFLELPKRSDYPPFHQGNYTFYFTMEQRVAAMNMMKIQASEKTWNKMKAYRSKVKEGNADVYVD